MVILYVSYQGDAKTRFDRDYWINVHLPLIRKCWVPHGLERTDGFFPVGQDSGVIAICACTFRDKDILQKALASPETKEIMENVINLTDVKPSIEVGTTLSF